MSSNNDVERIIHETEENIKVLELYGEGFSAPVLNEWRYATRHMSKVVFNSGVNDDRTKEELNRALAHLERARYDSYDFLLVYQIEEIKKFRDRYDNYIPVIKTVIPDYDSWPIALNDIVRLHREWCGKDNREGYYKEVKRANADLGRFLDILNNTKLDCEKRIAKFIRDRRIKTFIWLLSSAATIVATPFVAALVNKFMKQ